MPLLDGKLGIVFGVANQRSIAWAIAQAWAREGAKLAFTYQGDRVKESVAELAGAFGADTLILPCDVTKDDEIAGVCDIIKHYEIRAPLKRNVLPDELGATGVFLASDGAAAITGQVLYVDCGYQIMGMLSLIH